MYPHGSGRTWGTGHSKSIMMVSHLQQYRWTQAVLKVLCVRLTEITFKWGKMWKSDQILRSALNMTRSGHIMLIILVNCKPNLTFRPSLLINIRARFLEMNRKDGIRNRSKVGLTTWPHWHGLALCLSDLSSNLAENHMRLEMHWNLPQTWQSFKMPTGILIFLWLISERLIAIPGIDPHLMLYSLWMRACEHFSSWPTFHRSNLCLFGRQVRPSRAAMREDIAKYRRPSSVWTPRQTLPNKAQLETREEQSKSFS